MEVTLKCLVICSGPFQAGVFGKGQRLWGWSKEWQIEQEKSLQVVPVPLRMHGCDIWNAWAWTFDHVRMWVVGGITYIFHLGEGPPPGVLKSRNSTRMEFTMFRIMFWALR